MAVNPASKVLLVGALLLMVAAPTTALLDGPKLMAVKAALTLPDGALATWADLTEPCTPGEACALGSCPFEGVGCSAAGSVVELDLSGLGITGKLPAGLSSIPTLITVDLSDNDFSGMVPPAWSDLAALEVLNLDGNAALCGAAPEFLGGLPNATFALTGLGPASECTLAQHAQALTDAKAVLLDTAGALATWEVGSDPCGVRDCEPGACDWAGIKCSGYRVTAVTLASQGLGGPLPPSFGGLGSGLEALDLSGNALGGAVPPEWSALPATAIDVSGNADVCGAVPSGVPEVTSDGTRLGQPCATLAAHVTALLDIKGAISDSNGILASWVNGTDPCGGDSGTCSPRGTLCTWAGLTCSNFKVTGLELAGQSLSGDLPAVVGQITTLVTVDLSSNDFSGNLPAGWSQLGLVVSMNLANNRISGELPGSWGNGLAALDSLDVSSNTIEGGLPASWSKLSALTRIRLDDNRISGELPASWGDLPSVVEVRIARNQLEGLVPIEWQRLTTDNRLKVMDLQGNTRLCVSESFFPEAEVFRAGTQEGSVCDTAALLTIKDGLEDPDDAFNSWKAGTTPCTPDGNCDEGNCPWSHVTCFNNRVTELWLANKKLKGSLPEQLALSTDLEVVYLHNNRLKGFLPGAWSGMRRLRVLTLSKNDLEGEVPNAWGGMERLEGLFVNDNEEICGFIPGDLEDMVMGSCSTKIGKKCGEGEGWTRARVAKLVAPLCGLAFLIGLCYCQFRNFWHNRCPCCKSKKEPEDEFKDAPPVADPASPDSGGNKV